MKEKIQQILEIAVRAPSGDNSQPWSFHLSDNTLSVFALIEKDNAYLNVAGIGTYMAVGALIKNITIAAQTYGLIPSVRLFPETNNKTLVAEIVFNIGEAIENPLFSMIEKRSTNRKPYTLGSINQSYVSQVKEFASREGITVTFLSDREKMKVSARAASVMEETAFQVTELHKIFFNDIVWTQKEERQKKTGLYLKTLEVPTPVLLLFKLWRNPNIAKFFAKIGLPTKVAEQNAAIYAKAGALGLISFPDDSPLTSIKAGMVFQELWLLATKEEMYLQPICGTLFLNYKLQRDGLTILNQKQIVHIKDAAKNIKHSFGDPDGIPLMLFRIGYGKPPSARTSRFNVDELLK